MLARIINVFPLLLREVLLCFLAASHKRNACPSQVRRMDPSVDLPSVLEPL